MVKKKQEPTNPNPAQPVKETEDAARKQQEEQAGLFLKNILDPINITLQNITKSTNQNTEAIKILMEKPAQGFDVEKILSNPIVGGLVKVVMNFFTQPETPVEASKMGLFDEEMMAGFKANMLGGWKNSQDMLQEQLNQLKLENQARAKRLTEEI